VAAVVGHCFPPWLGFRGGKGVATALGVFLALAWPVFVIAIAVWLAVAKIWKISSLGALSAMGVSVIASVVLTPGPVGIGILVIAAFVAMRHQANIERLVKGTEPRIGEGK
jgi:glycerol-3-phosphate acyltransferase PlsY